MLLHSPRLTNFFAVFLVAVAASAIAQEPAEPDFRIEYSGAPGEVVVEYDVVNAIESTQDTGEPLLRVYGDGRVRVYRPQPLTGAGTFEQRRSTALYLVQRWVAVALAGCVAQ